jgi:hypothetical protein
LVLFVSSGTTSKDSDLIAKSLSIMVAISSIELGMISEYTV